MTSEGRSAVVAPIGSVKTMCRVLMWPIKLLWTMKAEKLLVGYARLTSRMDSLDSTAETALARHPWSKTTSSCQMRSQDVAANQIAYFQRAGRDCDWSNSLIYTG